MDQHWPVPYVVGASPLSRDGCNSTSIGRKPRCEMTANTPEQEVDPSFAAVQRLARERDELRADNERLRAAAQRVIELPALDPQFAPITRTTRWRQLAA